MRFNLIESDYEKYSQERLKAILTTYIEQKVCDLFFDFIIDNLVLNFSIQDSMLKVLVYYKGNIDENILNELFCEDEFTINDMKVDIVLIKI